jgi:DNA-directed RNA polymerase subunit beta'
VSPGETVAAGHVLAKTPREASGTQDITGGLPRVTEIFEARKPKDPAIMAEIDGTVELLGEKRRGKRTIVVKSESGIEREHLVTHGKHLRVHAGDFVKAGEALVDGPLVPHDILRISGEEEVQRYLVREIQNVYRSQRVDIDDKHIEIIVSQMLRKVKIETVGDTNLLPGSVLDKFEFRQANDQLAGCLRITDKGDSEFAVGSVVPKDVLAQTNATIETLGGAPAKGTRPKPATASTQLLGITKASVQSSSFISAASFQETTKVLTEAALAGKVDNLVGLKENVILGHLIPAGTGFNTFQSSEVRVRPEALESLRLDRETVLTRQFPLLEAAPAGEDGPLAAAPGGGDVATLDESSEADNAI